MPAANDFPHLQLTYRGEFTPRFNGGPTPNAEVDRIRANAAQHAAGLRARLDQWRVDFEQVRRDREARGLPAIPAEAAFVLRVPEGADGDQIAHALGVDLVAETSEGLMLVATADISAARLRQVIDDFELSGGRGQGGSILEVFTGPDDPRRLDQILTSDIRSFYPFEDARIYTLDFGIHSAESTRRVHFRASRRRKKGGETEEAFQARREAEHQQVRQAATDAWHDQAEQRFFELERFVSAHGGTIVDGPISEAEHEVSSSLVFPDSFQVRVRANGACVRDIVLNFPHLFEVALPPGLSGPEAATGDAVAGETFELVPPPADAPAVCIIDSGIEEGHRWLAAAIDRTTSRTFIPGADPAAIADEVSPRGHGTRVAGAVLYPSSVPANGRIEAIAWIQNARVLNDTNDLPETLPPEHYLAKVVEHFGDGPRATRIFNHSINAAAPSRQKRMSSWAAKIDQLSHEKDVLFIQSVGNIVESVGTMPGPGLRAHLRAGRAHPEHLFEASSRVANPGQALHALTVGSIAHTTLDDGGWVSYARGADDVSAFSRIGYAPPWEAVKPDVVDYGGDYCFSRAGDLVRVDARTAIEVVNSTMHGEAAIGRDGVGTSFAAPKVAHIAAHLQSTFPEVSPLLYRTLIVQSARWPAWAEAEPDKDRVLRMIGYGRPTVERATTNAAGRVTLITAEDRELAGKQYHLFTVKIPEEIRGPAQEARIRVDVTLAYTAEPRRTRARNRSYLETWLDWESSRLGEEVKDFCERLENGGGSTKPKFEWVLDSRDDYGEVEGTNRTRGSVQKDWAVFDAYNFPPEFAIAVRGHCGWNHREGEGKARYCLAVSFEALNAEIPLYEKVEAEIEVQPEIPARPSR